MLLLFLSTSAFVAPSARQLRPAAVAPSGVQAPSGVHLRPPLLEDDECPVRCTVQSRRAREPQLRDRERGWLQELWAKYVLIRPDMDVDEFKRSTKLRTARGWSWEERTPGTARTLVLSAALLCLFAIPVLVTNPTVFGYLLEFAALSREGVTPGEFWGEVLGRAFGQ